MKSPTQRKMKPLSFTQRVISYFSSGDAITKEINNDKSRYQHKQRKSLISETDKKRAIQTVIDSPYGAGNRTQITANTLLNYAGNTYKEQISVREENKQILAMTPELNKASDILISSIMSPNDLQYGILEITSDFDGDIPDDTRNKINIFLTEYIEKKLNLSKMFPVYLKNILYISGAEAILVLPHNVLTKMIGVKPESGISEESLTVNGSLENKLDVLEDIDFYTNLKSTYSNERLVDDNITKVDTKLANKYDSVFEELKIPTNKRDATIQNIRKNFFSKENITLTNNIGITALGKMLASVSAEKQQDNYDEMLSIPKTDNKDVKGEPIITRISTLALSVLYAPGSPEEHLGYICLLDENGTPITDDEFYSDYNQQQSMNGASGNNIQFLANAFGNAVFDNNNGLLTKSTNSDIIASLYQDILEEHIKESSRSFGLSGVSIGNNNTLFRYVFFRYLSQRRTRLLFIPKQYLTYMAFTYDSHTGCGVTTIEENKNVFKMRICVVMSRIISQMNNSIDRKKIVVRTNDLFNGDIDELMYDVVEKYVEKQFTGFSANPNVIGQQLVRSSISVRIEGGAQGGVNSETLDTEITPVDRGAILIDSDLLDDLNDRCMSSMIVPQSAINKTAEDEFAVGIVSAQIMYKNKVSLLQATSSIMLTDVAQKVCMSSEYVRRGLHKFIEGSVSSKPSIKGELEVDRLSEKSNSVTNIIKNLKVNFPQPDITPSKNQFETLSMLSDSLSKIYGDIFTDELGGTDDKIKENLSLIRAHSVSKALVENAKKLGIDLNELPNLGDIKIADVLQTKQQLINMSEAIDSQTKAFGGGDGDEDGSFGSGGGDDNSWNNDGGDEDDSSDDFGEDSGDDGFGDEGGESDEGDNEPANEEKEEDKSDEDAGEDTKE